MLRWRLDVVVVVLAGGVLGLLRAFVPGLFGGALVAAVLAAPVPPATLVLPGAAGGIGFDDLVFSEELHRLVVPAGRTGRLDLVDPGTGAIESIEGFGSAASRASGHGEGTTSADAGQGYLFASDRTERIVAVVDPRARRILARVKLGGGPDYVRWVGATREVWVTEPGRKAIEIFKLEPGPPPRLAGVGSISVPGGPESLVVDPAGRRAYTNTFQDETVAIDVASRAIAARWPNGCRGARGIALDAARGLLFVGCEEGRAVSLDLARGGKRAGEAKAGEGVDVIAYSPRLAHLYVPAADGASLTVMGVGSRGELEALGTIATAPEAHCAATDDRGTVYVCDPQRGRLLVLHDPHPASR
jgi:DNA-binding beta-propeller fold protein YncE